MRSLWADKRAAVYSPLRAQSLAQTTHRYRYTRWHWRWLSRALDGVFGPTAPLWQRLVGRTAPATPRSILVLQLDHFGDAVLTTSIFPLLHHRFPETKIDVLASPWNREVFENNPHVRRIHVSPRNWFHRQARSRVFGAESLRLGMAMRAFEYDLGIDVRGDFLGALLLWMARIPRRLGWAAGGGAFLLTDSPAWVPHRPETRSRVALLEPLGVAGQSPARPQIYPQPCDRKAVERRLQAAFGPLEDTTLVVVHVSAGTDAKRWPALHWRELLRGLTTRPRLKVVLVGAASDRGTSWQIAQGLDRTRVADWTAQMGILELAALVQRAQLFLGADSGPAHVAGWAGTPSLVLFSGTNVAAQWQPPGRHVHVLRSAVACSPCHRKQCAFAYHPCMARLTPEAVGRAVDEVLAPARVQRPTLRARSASATPQHSFAG